MSKQWEEFEMETGQGAVVVGGQHLQAGWVHWSGVGHSEAAGQGGNLERGL